ncbi:GNAT family protein [Haladaptatus sp. DJG-WS-42]|uniref:GNAT family N-acetyltransferase n=1 Tax=Haladaptatus sp. DJG-WS-42 TaxID=3120516 RepID=UPI0030CAE0B6
MPGAIVLEGKRVSLATVEAEDLDFLRDNVNHPAVRVPVGQQLPTNGYQERQYFEEMSTDNNSLQLLIVSNDRRVGVVELDPIDRETGQVELAYWLVPDYQGEGYAKAAVELAIEYCFDQLRMHRIQAAVFSFNEASMGLLKRLGFTAEGVHREDVFINGEYHDTHYFGLLEAEWRKASAQ